MKEKKGKGAASKKTQRSWKHTKKRKPGRRSVKQKAAGDPSALNTERLGPIILKAHLLRSEGYYLYEVAAKLAEEFGIKPPSEASISRWFAEANKAFLEDIKSYRAQQVFAAMARLDRQIRKFLPIATADDLPVTRYKMIDGERMPYIDEDSFAEQARAAEVVLKAEVVRAELLGLKAGAALMPDKDGDQSQADLFAFITKMAAQGIVAHSIDITPTADRPILELKSGFQDIYESAYPDEEIIP